MNVLAILIPISVAMGLAGLAAFVWTIRSGQFDDPEGDQARALSDAQDARPICNSNGDGHGKPEDE
ncbi:Cytochrome oxidase maturation protein cbb3-type [Rhodobacteraceae bacterium THAF1]|uniref:cbb3-type cytochrome oxidase assembly protein CcoS n=1 Tax=Palleronia sp. THAF1 TaxID=2587842 RepID=UPI000F3B3DA6|nr:cbb3-type cytochrome oxidase assembly protein CcoS [Palleronia sp. THAF1]QFU08808.1 Cytochrome oxidase maturation protein cbb3-type [Palleronia sp. THAF1]VDC23943.1 Cytochrome oxidase maturation protein cbb3-type [Rhodobacteraceae bacterium THAF1]